MCEDKVLAELFGLETDEEYIARTTEEERANEAFAALKDIVNMYSDNQKRQKTLISSLGEWKEKKYIAETTYEELRARINGYMFGLELCDFPKYYCKNSLDIAFLEGFNNAWDERKEKALQKIRSAQYQEFMP